METLNENNAYTKMQLAHYQNEGRDINGGMNRENHMFHNNNPEYWSILVKDTEDPSFKNKIGLDFGCGCGRNILNLHDRFLKFDGVDIASNLIERTRENLIKKNIPTNSFDLYTCNGINLSVIKNNNYYDFIMSTIVLQHICVYDIRLSYLKEFYRLLKKDGILSFQMGFGKGHGKVSYFDNYYQATSTNSGCDVIVSSPDEIINDLKNIGFNNITYKFGQPYADGHEKWIFIRCIKS